MKQLRNENNTPNTEFLTIADVAGICQVSTKTVRRWIKDGDLVTHRMGNQHRIVRPDFDTFVRLQRGR